MPIDWKLDRDLPVPVAEQLKGQIIYAISFGNLQPGDALPSVRELAAEVRVSPVTVSKVYRDLIHDRMLVSKPAIGVFVGELGLCNGKTHDEIGHKKLFSIIENAIRQAKLLGYSLTEIERVVHQVEDSLKSDRATKSIVLVGNFSGATTYYARTIEELLSDLDLKVMPLLYSNLLTDMEQYREVLNAASLIVTLPRSLQDVKNLLGPRYQQIIAIAFELSEETIQNLAAIHREYRVGIISTWPEYVHTMINELAVTGHSIPPERIALVSKESDAQEVISNIDVLVYASGSEKALEWIPSGMPAFEFLHTPKPSSVHRIRAMLNDQSPE